MINRILVKNYDIIGFESLIQVNLSGGYYDAGDNVKFGWPMAFSISLLSWAANEYGNEINSENQLRNLRSAIRWGTNFLLRAHTSSTTLYTQVLMHAPFSFSQQI